LRISVEEDTGVGSNLFISHPRLAQAVHLARQELREPPTDDVQLPRKWIALAILRHRVVHDAETRMIPCPLVVVKETIDGRLTWLFVENFSSTVLNHFLQRFQN
jgi:hypothetical protein